MGTYESKLHVTYTGKPDDTSNSGRTILKNFPGARRGKFTIDKTQKLFMKYNFTKESTLFATSTCPDEINRVFDLFSGAWGGNFTLGGLAGLPFTGKTGFGALSSHVPDDGELLILFAPHIGVTKEGEIGNIRRAGMTKDTTACGSCMAAYEAAQKLKRTNYGSNNSACHPSFWKPNFFLYEGKKETELIGDKQQNVVNKVVRDFLPLIKESKENPAVALANLMYEKIKQEILKIIPDDFPAPIGLIGGVHINTDKQERIEDFFVVKDVLLRRGPNKKFDDLTKEYYASLPN